MRRSNNLKSNRSLFGVNSTVKNKLAQYCRSPWYDLSHIHPSLIGFKKRNLEVLVEIEKYIGEKLDKRNLQHQRWIFFDLDNSEYDAVFVHSVNPNGTAYPTEFDVGRITTSNKKRYAHILKSMTKKGYLTFKVKGSPAIIALQPK